MINESQLYHIDIPQRFFDVEYKTDRIPGVKDPSDFSLGANCQVFAYELLRVNGMVPPNDRSSELWSDTCYSRKILVDFEPLDIMLYSADGEAYGAHVGVYIGDGEIIHLSLQNGRSEIIEHEIMQENKKYRRFVGAKRILKTVEV